MTFKLYVIVACCENFGIGFNGTLPWRLKNELAYFTNMTSGGPQFNKMNAVIMGRKTWQSIPVKFRPLPCRINIVLTSDVGRFQRRNVYWCNSILAVEDVLNNTLSRVINIAWVIGGASMYEWALKRPDCERIYLTWIKKKFECDTFFPPIPEHFQQIEDSSVPQGEQQEGDIKYEYRVYENVLYNPPVETADETEKPGRAPFILVIPSNEEGSELETSTVLSQELSDIRKDGDWGRSDQSNYFVSHLGPADYNSEDLVPSSEELARRGTAAADYKPKDMVPPRT